MGRFKSRATFLRIIAGKLSGILHTGKLFSRICNSAAVSWGFAIPTSTVLFVYLSNRITNSYIHCRRIANSPEQSTFLHLPATLFREITWLMTNFVYLCNVQKGIWLTGLPGGHIYWKRRLLTLWVIPESRKFNLTSQEAAVDACVERQLCPLCLLWR